MLASIVRVMLRQRLIVVVVSLALCAAGILAAKNLSVDAFPDVTNIQVQVATVAVGRSPEEIERLVTVPVEIAMTGLTSTQLKSLKKIYAGKVRELYEIDDKRMLMIATDRLSAFDVILAEPIPDKGKILTAISNFWFEQLKAVVPNHLTGERAEDMVSAEDLPQVEGRGVVAKRLKPVAVEAIVRGYLAGSGWKEYQKSGTVCGLTLPAGLREADKLPVPIFTPLASMICPLML